MTQRVRLRGAFVLLVLIMPSASDAQSLPVTSPDGRRALAAARADGPIVVDGMLDEPIWRTAAVATGFVQSEPIEGQPASEEFFLENSGICYFGDVPRNQRRTTRFRPPADPASSTPSSRAPKRSACHSSCDPDHARRVLERPAQQHPGERALPAELPAVRRPRLAGDRHRSRPAADVVRHHARELPHEQQFTDEAVTAGRGVLVKYTHLFSF